MKTYTPAEAINLAADFLTGATPVCQFSIFGADIADWPYWMDPTVRTEQQAVVPRRLAMGIA